jgi:hypothetical protein
LPAIAVPCPASRHTCHTQLTPDAPTVTAFTSPQGCPSGRLKN